ncbi:hypothetical protein UB45_01240 [Terrabacter sp. 28]|nr:hypothetical protein UB45_01240 [Terrabacter sp. 28]
MTAHPAAHDAGDDDPRDGIRPRDDDRHGEGAGDRGPRPLRSVSAVRPPQRWVQRSVPVPVIPESG